MQNQKELLWVYVIRGFATFSVIWLHAAAPLLYKFNDLPIAYWWIGNIYDSSVRMCVPLFFMLSGYLLLRKDESPSAYFHKRITKVVIPLVVWSFFYLLWRGSIEYTLNIPFSVAILRSIVTPMYYHLWFLYALLGIYLCMPILRIVIQKAHRGLLYYFIGLWFLAVSIIPMLERLLNTTSKVDLGMVSGYIGYLVIGYVLGEIEFSKKVFWIANIVMIICIGITAIGTFYLTKNNNGIYDNYFYAYMSPSVVLLSVSSFILLKHLSDNANLFRHKASRNIAKAMTSMSLGIYFVHPVFLYLFEHGYLGFTLSVSALHPLIRVPLIAILTFVFSFTTTFILKKIPIVNKCVP